MAHPVPPIVYVHMSAAFAALALGTFQLWRPKGTYSHRKLGWTWIALMLTVAVSSLWIPRFMQLSWIHVFTLVTLVSIPLALWHIRRGNVRGHASAMKGVYIGGLIIAGAFTLLPGRAIGNLIWRGVWGYL
jgi:uncharacterized membrane protein